ncbi:MAG: hypothetical protein COA58_12510 [Bacteroidetes bacterium]|nr:MAG: hypothetical protein COA58_12510 [Bacteroidota bacterium]
MFLLPTVGVHIDLSYCCETQTEQANHVIALDVSHCCMPTQHNNCLSNDEICIAPTEQTFTSQSEFSITPVAIITLPYIQECECDYHLLACSSEIDKGFPLLKETSPSFLQVFLC